MSFLKHYTLKYTPLSPIHIGTGDSYEPTNYVIDDDTLYEFDTGAAVAALTETDRAQLSKIVSARPDTQMLKAVQKFFYDRREALKPWAVNAIPVLDGVARLYEDRVGKSANREADGKQVINRLEIDRTAYNPINRQPVLFGSSVKGAIRTALLDKINAGARARPNERKGLHEFQGRLLKYRDPERGRLQLELDPLRLISFSDAIWQQEPNLPTSQVFLAVNRKKSPVVNQEGKLRQAMGENLYQILECVPACYARTFTGQLTLQSVGSDNHRALPAAELRFTAEEIAQTCNLFYLPILTAERKLMQERNYLHSGWNQTITDILALNQDKLKTGKAFMLRVGRHSGADSVTVSGARNGNIKIIKGKGQQPEYADSPKTLWLAAQTKEQRTDLLPFGWVLVEIEPGASTAKAWPELTELCASQQHDARRWAEKQAKQKAELQEKRRETEQRREREETERRRQAELAAQAEQERQAKEEANRQRLQSMTPEQLQIDGLKQKLQEKQAVNAREQIGGPLYSELRELIGGAAAWPAEDKAELHHVGKDILKFIGAEGNKKAKELLKTLQ